MASGAARIDVVEARKRLDHALDDHEQAFERFFLTDMLKNPQGVLHGGVMASAMDISMGHLVAKVAGPGATIEMKVQFMRPVASGLVTCEGRFTKRGRAISFMESHLYDADGKLAAHATATWKMPG
jgi:uncharacterized protein (TIGR00369 family)